MLIGLDPLLTPDLLHALATMGHGDRIVLVDANYPASRGCRLIEVAGADIVQMLRAVLSVMPVDHFIPHPCMVMEVVDNPDAEPPVCQEMNGLLAAHKLPRAVPIDRHGFYDTAQAAYAIVRTGERRLYGNILLTKGVIPPARS